VLPEFGRDKDLNQRNGLDHGDRSDELHKVFLIAAGPDIKKGKVVTTEVRTTDLCPTVMSLFTKKPAAFSQSKPIRDLFGEVELATAGVHDWCQTQTHRVLRTRWVWV
jgi:hypothetical protein